MARPARNNAEYFYHSANFRNDRRVKAIRARFGIAGYGLLLMIMEALTDAEHTQLDTSDMELELLAGDFGVSATEIDSLLQICEKIGLFCRNNDGLLISPELNESLKAVFDKRNRSKETFEKRKQGVSVAETPVSVTDTPRIEEKGIEENKSEEIKERLGGDSAGADAPTTTEPGSSLPASPSLVPPSQQPPNGATQKPPGSAAPPKPAAAPKPDLETRRDAFKESVRDYYRNNRTKYPDTMYPAFIAYWAESDGKKMRWEKETVFEIPNRLSTWHQRETKSVAPNKTLQVNGNGRNTRTEPVPGQPFGKL